MLRTRWPWLGAAIAAVIWAPNVLWQAMHGWPELAMASALHQQNTSLADYLSGVPVQLLYAGLLAVPLIIAGFVRLWREPGLRFLAVTATLLIVYVAAWVPGKVYYSEGMAPVVLAAGAVARSAGPPAAASQACGAGSWWSPGLLSMGISLPTVLPIVPVASCTPSGTWTR